MGDDDVRHGGALDWLRMGCGVVLLLGVPLWAGLTALNVHGWVFEYKVRNGMETTPSPAEMMVAWVRSGIPIGALVALLGVATVLLVAVARRVDLVATWEEARRAGRRYDRAVGERDVIEPHAWDHAAEDMAPEPPEDSDVADAPTDPGPRQ